MSAVATGEETPIAAGLALQSLNDPTNVLSNTLGIGLVIGSESAFSRRTSTTSVDVRTSTLTAFYRRRVCTAA